MSDGQTELLEAEERAKKEDLLTRYVHLEKRRRDLESQLDEIKPDLSRLQEAILEEWADRGQQNATVDGLTLYVAMDFFCNKKGGIDSGLLNAALRKHGLGNLINETCNASSLKAWVKERLAAGDEIPEGLRALLSYDEVPRLRTRQAK